MKNALQIRLLFLVLLSLTITHLVLAQDIKENHQLLWEISGNGLEQPSYLYGTIHLADKRAFEFSDSVLLKLESVDAFAMELLPNDIMQFMFEEIMTYDPYNEKRWKTEIGEERYKQLDEWIKSEVHFSLANINIDYSWALSFLLTSSKPSPKKGDKATFLDGHLYQLAKVQGKKTLSLEDVKDQIKLNEEVSIKEQVAEIERYIQVKNGEEVIEKEVSELLDIYHSGDLEGIDKYIQKYSKEDALLEYEHMIERNIKMADNIEAYTKSQTIFAAVGAAHLAGKGSIIDLLQQKGYTLRAVPAIFTGLAAKYEPKKSEKETEWETFELPFVMAQIDLPSKPYQLKIAELPSFFRTYTYPDLGEGVNYMVMSMAFPLSTTTEAVEQVFLGYPKNMIKGKDAKILHQENVLLGDYQGYDVTIVENNTEYGRYRLFLRDKTIYINALTSTQEKLLQEKNAQRFFGSFKIKNIKTSTNKTIASKAGAFKVEMPHEAEKQMQQIPGAEGGVQGQMHIYQSIETLEKSEIVYIASYQEFVAGWLIGEDEPLFENVLQNLFNRLGAEPEVRDTSIMGYPGKLASMRSPNQNIDVQLLIRGSRLYMVFVLVGGEDQPAKRHEFMKSFELLEEEVSEQRVYKVPDTPISFLVFHEPKIDVEELGVFEKRTYQINSHTIYYSLDNNTGINYTTSIYKFLPYTHFENADTAFNRMIELLSTSDSLIHSEKQKKPAHLEWEYVTKSPKVHTFTRGKCILKDGVFYEFSAVLPKEKLYSEAPKRNVPVLGRPIAGPVKASASSIDNPKSNVNCCTFPIA